MKLRDIIIIVVIAVSIFLVTRVVIQNFVVDGESMLPNLKGKEWVLVNKVVYKLHPL
jgi:signal peptidase I